MKGIGPRIREIRKERGLTLAQLSELAGIDISTIWGYEVERHTPNMYTVELILDALGYDVVLKKRDEA